MVFLARYAMKGPLYAALTALCFSLFPIINWIATALIALVTLRHGFRQGLWLVLLVCGVGITRAFLEIHYSTDPDIIEHAAILREMSIWAIIMQYVPVFLMAVFLAKTTSLKNTLTVACGVLCIGVLVSTLFSTLPTAVDIEPLIRENAKNMMDETTASANTGSAGVEQHDLTHDLTHPPKMTEHTIKHLAMLFSVGWPGMVYLLYCVSLFIARYWQAALYNPGGFQAEFHSLHMDTIFGLAAFALLGAGFAFQLPFMADVMLVLAGCLVTLFGLGVVHWVASFYKWHWSILMALYSLVLFNPFWAGIVLIIIAVGDSQFDIRAYLQRQRSLK